LAKRLRRRRLAKQGGQFLPRAVNDPLQVDNEVGVYRVIARVEGLDCLLTASDENREQRDFSFVRASFDSRVLPRRLKLLAL
jgi:hypothetical protein